MIILLDFDSTVVSHCYPEIGHDIGAEPILKKLVAAGHKIILFTMRGRPKPGSGERDLLQEAVDWFEERGIPLYGVNNNKTQWTWTTSKKIYGHLIIDDTALGCPLVYPENNERPYVDWVAVEKWLTENGWIR